MCKLSAMSGDYKFYPDAHKNDPHRQNQIPKSLHNKNRTPAEIFQDSQTWDSNDFFASWFAALHFWVMCLCAHTETQAQTSFFMLVVSVASHPLCYIFNILLTIFQ